jgi:hypothetical protein
VCLGSCTSIARSPGHLGQARGLEGTRVGALKMPIKQKRINTGATSTPAASRRASSSSQEHVKYHERHSTRSANRRLQALPEGTVPAESSLTGSYNKHITTAGVKSRDLCRCTSICLSFPLSPSLSLSLYAQHVALMFIIYECPCFCALAHMNTRG